MIEESTDLIQEKILNSNSLDDLTKIIDSSNATYNKTFQDYFNEYLALNPSLSLSEIIKDSGMDKSYAHQIINGTKTNIGRDYIIALCYASRMNLNELNHALLCSKNQQIYVKNKRDALLCYAFSKTSKETRALVTELNIVLSNKEFEPIKISKGSV